MWWMKGDSSVWLAADLVERVMRLGALVGGGLMVYIMCLAGLGLRPRMFMLHGRTD